MLSVVRVALIKVEMLSAWRAFGKRNDAYTRMNTKTRNDLLEITSTHEYSIRAGGNRTLLLIYRAYFTYYIFPPLSPSNSLVRNDQKSSLAISKFFALLTHIIWMTPSHKLALYFTPRSTCGQRQRFSAPNKSELPDRDKKRSWRSENFNKRRNVLYRR